MTTPRSSSRTPDAIQPSTHCPPPMKHAPLRDQPLTAAEVKAIDDWCARNLHDWHPETQAAFRRSLIEKADLRLSCLGWTRL
jgi:hypothetical protein